MDTWVPRGGAAGGRARRVSVGGMLGISQMPCWSLDKIASPWHSGENVCGVLPSPHFAQKGSKGQRGHGEGDIGV